MNAHPEKFIYIITYRSPLTSLKIIWWNSFDHEFTCVQSHANKRAINKIDEINLTGPLFFIFIFFIALVDMGIIHE